MNTATPVADPVSAPSTPSREKLNALLVEDNAADSELVLRELRRGGFDVSASVVQAAAEFRQKVRAQPPDIVLADYNLGQWRGMEALDILRVEGLDIPLILVSGALGDVTAVECIKQGATDYVLKESLARLPVCVRRALREQTLKKQRSVAEEDLAAKARELARSNEELEQFAYIASHDLQEPLRMVATYAQLLAERYQGKLDDQADKYLHYAVDGATRLQTMIQDLLAVSRAGRHVAELKITDFNLIVERALANLRATISQHGAVIQCEPLPHILADDRQLVQVFQNLLGNAIKFHSTQPPVVRISAEKCDGHWTFSISDNGIGIPPEHLNNIFVMFKRLHTREEYTGNGIGLAITRKIIESNGGSIWADSQPGSGTTFKFTLPAEPPHRAHEQTDETNGGNLDRG